jgi:Prokaryotic E2 family E
MINFLPEDDQEYLENKEIKFELLTEKDPDGNERRGVLFPAFSFTGNLRSLQNGNLVSCDTCALLVIIPKGYATTKLDSFYTSPHLKRHDGTDPQNANNATPLFERSWQFWSRHLDDKDWRIGIDGLSSYLNYIHSELRMA